MAALAATSDSPMLITGHMAARNYASLVQYIPHQIVPKGNSCGSIAVPE
jgi:hypothetical protein